MNLVILIGNMTRDPEMRYTPAGKAVCSFSIATNEKSGEREQVEFHNIVAWEKTGELVAQWCKKGTKVAINGKLNTRSWEAPDGTKRKATEIIANRVEFLGGTRGRDEATAAVGDGAASPSTVDPEEIPF